MLIVSFEIGFQGFLINSKPENACEPIIPPPLKDNSSREFIVLIRRLDCNFDIKVSNFSCLQFRHCIGVSEASKLCLNTLLERSHTVESICINQIWASCPPNFFLLKIVGTMSHYFETGNTLKTIRQCNLKYTETHSKKDRKSFSLFSIFL